MKTYTHNLSKRLLELDILLPDTGLWWVKPQDIWFVAPNVSSNPNWKNETKNYPALTLSSLLCLLPVIGEKLGWGEEVCFECGKQHIKQNDECKTHYAIYQIKYVYISRGISDIFLSNPEQEAYKKSEKYLMELLKWEKIERKIYDF